jgi:hypothetical protein
MKLKKLQLLMEQIYRGYRCCFTTRCLLSKAQLPAYAVKPLALAMGICVARWKRKAGCCGAAE